MNLAASDGQSVEDIFGDQSTHSRHALVARAHACDAIFAVGDMTERELRFLSPSFRNYPIDRVYNGVPCEPIEMEQKERSRRKLQDYGEALLGYRPDFVFTHVTRPVKSKGYWRDLQVLTGLDEAFRKDGRKGVLFVVSTAVGSREATQVEEMVSSYGWPVHHEVGFPDLVGSEVDYWRAISEFNAYAESIRAVLVNQFGWDRASCGPAMPDDMTFADLRRGSDVEFGLSVYEPFGIAQVEPLGAGTICAVSSVCGCVSAVEAAGGQEPNLMVADYTAERSSIAEAIGMTSAEREGVEWKCSRALADRLYAALPETDTELAALIYYRAIRCGGDDVGSGVFAAFLPRFTKVVRLENQMNSWSVKVIVMRTLFPKWITVGLVALLFAGCGSRDPSPVGLNLLEESVGQTVEVPPIEASAARTNFDGLNAFILGAAGELIIGQVQGVAYRSLLRARFDSAGVILQADDIVRAELVLSLVTTGQRGEGGIGLSSSLADWTEGTAFVDTTGQEIPFTMTSESPSLAVVQEDSVLTLTLPLGPIQSALTNGAPDVSFILGPAEDTVEDYLIIVGSREFFADLNGDGLADEEAVLKRPILRLVNSADDIVEIPLSEDTYYGLKEASVPDGTLLLQAGIARSVHLQFDLPLIPSDATINFVELSADVIQDASLSDGLVLNIRRVDVDVAGQDTTFVRVRDTFSTFTASGTSSVMLFPVDHLIVQTWVSGVAENEGIALFPSFEGRYEWLEIRNPTLRVIYTIPPGDNG